MWGLLALAALAVEPPRLAPGDPAPPLELSEWFVGEPVVPATSGRATLVEFTATWCGPCQAALPVIVRIARERAADLDVVAVHVWENDASSVQGHIERHLADELPPHIGLSPGLAGFAQVEWMGGADLAAVPTFFLVDATGTLAWIGYSDEMPRAVDKVLAGGWDLAAARSAYIEVHRAEVLHDRWSTEMILADTTPSEGGRWVPPPREQLAMLDALEAADADARLGLADVRFPLLQVVDRRAAAAFAVELAAATDRVGASTLNAVAWELVRDGSKMKIDPAVIRTLSEASNERQDWANPYFLDTWAHVLWREGDRDGAIAAEEKVLSLDPDDSTREWATAELERFRSAKPKH